MAKETVNIRLEGGLWRQARSVAVTQKMTMQDWLTDAITLKLLADGVIPVVLGDGDGKTA